MAKTKDEKNSDRRHKRAIARTKALGAVVHADRSTSGLRRLHTKIARDETDIARHGSGLHVSRQGIAKDPFGQYAVIATTSNFYSPAEQIGKAIAAAMAAPVKPSPVTTPAPESVTVAPLYGAD